MNWITCWTLKESGAALDAKCCSSCHEDHDLGYDDLCTVYDPDDEYLEVGVVCCGMATYLDEHPQPDAIRKLQKPL